MATDKDFKRLSKELRHLRIGTLYDKKTNSFKNDCVIDLNYAYNKNFVEVDWYSIESFFTYSNNLDTNNLSNDSELGIGAKVKGWGASISAAYNQRKQANSADQNLTINANIFKIKKGNIHLTNLDLDENGFFSLLLKRFVSTIDGLSEQEISNKFLEDYFSIRSSKNIITKTSLIKKFKEKYGTGCVNSIDICHGASAEISYSSKNKSNKTAVLHEYDGEVKCNWFDIEAKSTSQTTTGHEGFEGRLTQKSKEFPSENNFGQWIQNEIESVLSKINETTFVPAKEIEKVKQIIIDPQKKELPEPSPTTDSEINKLLNKKADKLRKVLSLDNYISYSTIIQELNNIGNDYDNFNAKLESLKNDFISNILIFIVNLSSKDSADKLESFKNIVNNKAFGLLRILDKDKNTENLFTNENKEKINAKFDSLNTNVDSEKNYIGSIAVQNINSDEITSSVDYYNDGDSTIIPIDALYNHFEVYDFEIKTWEELDPDTFSIPLSPTNCKAFNDFLNVKMDFSAYLNFFNIADTAFEETMLSYLGTIDNKDEDYFSTVNIDNEEKIFLNKLEKEDANTYYLYSFFLKNYKSYFKEVSNGFWLYYDDKPLKDNFNYCMVENEKLAVKNTGNPQSRVIRNVTLGDINATKNKLIRFFPHIEVNNQNIALSFKCFLNGELIKYVDVIVSINYDIANLIFYPPTSNFKNNDIISINTFYNYIPERDKIIVSIQKAEQDLKNADQNQKKTAQDNLDLLNLQLSQYENKNKEVYFSYFTTSNIQLAKNEDLIKFLTGENNIINYSSDTKSQHKFILKLVHLKTGLRGKSMF